MRPSTVDRIARFGPMIFAPAGVYLVLVFVGILPGFAFLSAWAVCLFGVVADILRKWRTERGLWMLACLCCLFALCMLAPFLLDLADVLAQGQLRNSPAHLLGTVLGLVASAMTLYFSITVVSLNIKETHARPSSCLPGPN